MLGLKLLGVPGLRWQGRQLGMPSPKAFALLSYLATVGEARTRSELLETFWSSGKPANLRFALHKLREVPGASAWLVVDGPRVRVDVDSDVRRLAENLREGRPEAALAAWCDGETDKAFLRGFELPGAPRFTAWLEEERVRFDTLRLASLAEAVASLERRGDTAEGLRLARWLVDLDPLDESAHRAVMRLARASGDEEGALAQFEACRQLLAREVGVEPSKETLELLATIEGPSTGAEAAARLVEARGDIPGLPDELVGRAGLVDEVAELLRARGRVLLHGLGGVGKTALAAVLVDERLTRDTGPALWVQVGHDPPGALFGAVASALGARQEVDRAADPRRAVGRLLTERGVGLVVLDDVWNAYSLSKLAEAVPAHVAVLVTSRHRHANLVRREVGRLERPASIELLSLHAGRPMQDAPGTDALCDVLGDHAFAVRLAGISLAVDELSADALLERIAGRPHALGVAPDFGEGNRWSVASLLTASLDEVPDASHEAFMAFGALYAPAASPELLALCTRREVDETEDALFELQRRGLAQRIAERGQDRVRYQLHDLSFSFARAHSHTRPSTAERACEALLAQYSGDFGALDVDLVHLLGAARAFRERGDDARLVRLVGQLVIGHAYFQARGHTPLSLGLLASAVAAAKRSGDLENAQRLSARLGDAHRELYEDFGAATHAFSEALEIARARGDERGEVVMLTLLGTTRSQQGSAQADGYLDRAQRIAERVGDGRALCQVLEHRGCLAVREERHERARHWFDEGFRAIERLRSDSSVEPTELARLRFFMLLNSGEAERAAGRLRESLVRRSEALELATSEGNDVWMAYALHELGETHHQLGDRASAQLAYQRAVELYRDNGVTSALHALTAFLEGEGYALPDGLGAGDARRERGRSPTA